MFKFSIRDILWLTAFVAMALAWWVDHRHLLSQLRPWGVVVAPPIPDAADREIEAQVQAQIAEMNR